MSTNIRTKNGSRRRKLLKWVRLQQKPCWICGISIDYSLPARDDESFECDELIPVSKGGSPYARENADATHRCCNNWRGNKSVATVKRIQKQLQGKYSTPKEFTIKAKALEKNITLFNNFEKIKTSTTW